jgi:hypothetical protein
MRLFESPARYQAAGAFYLLPPAARFNTLLNLPERENIGQKINEAMRWPEIDAGEQGGGGAGENGKPKSEIQNLKWADLFPSTRKLRSPAHAGPQSSGGFWPALSRLYFPKLIQEETKGVYYETS